MMCRVKVFRPASISEIVDFLSRIPVKLCLRYPPGFHQVTKHIGVRSRFDGMVLVLVVSDQITEPVKVQLLAVVEVAFCKQLINHFLGSLQMLIGPDRGQREHLNQFQVGVALLSRQPESRLNGHRSPFLGFRLGVWISVSSEASRSIRTRPSTCPRRICVGHDSEDEDLLAGIQDASDQTVLVAANVKDHATADEARTSEFRFHVPPRLPKDRSAVHVRVPRARSEPSASWYPDICQNCLNRAFEITRIRAPAALIGISANYSSQTTNKQGRLGLLPSSLSLTHSLAQSGTAPALETMFRRCPWSHRGRVRVDDFLWRWWRKGGLNGLVKPCRDELANLFVAVQQAQGVCRYTAPMRISPTLLSPTALRAVVQEFVTRDGTDHTSVERRIENVMRQLDAGRVELHFDGKTETCNILPVDENPPTGGSDE